MARIVIASVSESNREQVSRLLASSGFSVYQTCSSGSGLRRALASCEDGVLIQIGRIPDVNPDELIWDWGDRIQMLMIARPEVLENIESRDIFRLDFPASGQAILGAVGILTQLHRMRLPQRQGDEKATVERAKRLLMERRGMTEPEAHRLLQQMAMNRGMRMAECAEKIVENLGESQA